MVETEPARAQSRMQPVAVGPEPAKLRALPLLRAAAGTYRRQFAGILMLGALVVGPLSVLDGLVTHFADSYVDDARGWLQGLLTAATVVDLGAGIAALTFLAGFIDRLVAADRGGHRRPSLLATARALPWHRLILADLMVWGLSMLASFLFVLPGLLVFTLLCVTGPVVIVEGRGAWRALIRSARLVWPQFLLAFVLVTLPTMAEEALSDLVFESSVFEHLPYMMLADIALSVLVTSALGVLEVTMAHALIDRDRRLRSRTAGPPSDT